MKKKLGRPPTGLGKHGEPACVRDYPKLLINIRPSTKAKLKARAVSERRAAWLIVEDALQAYLSNS